MTCLSPFFHDGTQKTDVEWHSSCFPIQVLIRPRPAWLQVPSVRILGRARGLKSASVATWFQILSNALNSQGCGLLNLHRNRIKPQVHVGEPGSGSGSGAASSQATAFPITVLLRTFECGPFCMPSPCSMSELWPLPQKHKTVFC